MAGVVFALLAGINDYGGRLNTLGGCVADVYAFRDFLRARVTEPNRRIRCLVDGEADRSSIIAGFTEHLARAGDGDVAIFYFSGHGSQEPVEPRYWHLEPSGWNQTIVCADSRRTGIPDLADKELNVLIGEVAADGAHVLVVLDCCYSGGGTRAAEARVRSAPAATAPRALEKYLPGVQRMMRVATRADQPDPADGSAHHVTLAACESHQLSVELPIGEGYRGVFSAMLERALAALGPDATYRELVGAASVGVRDRVSNQQPVGYADPPDRLDQPLFGGAVRTGRSRTALEYYHDAWWINTGAVHGIQQPTADGDATVLAVVAPTTCAGQPAPSLGTVRVTGVEPARSRVVADGWRPDPAQRYTAVVVDLPLPPATVVLRGDGAGSAPLRAAVGDSPHVREVGSDGPGPTGDLFLVFAENGTLAVARADGTPLAAPVTASADGVRTTLGRLEHLARWHLIKRLDNPASGLAGAVSIEIVPAEPGERPPPPGEREPLAAGADGYVHLSYRETPNGLRCPYVFLYLHNHSDRDLFCTLLDLTDRFRCHNALLPGTWIPAGRTAVAFEGRPIDVSVPAERVGTDRGEVYDWLKLIAAEQRFGSSGYNLPNLDGHLARRSATRTPGHRTVLDRLADRAVTRDAGAAVFDALDWTTALLTLHTLAGKRP